jgi:molybdate transport system substrate-binding protein
MRLRTTRRYALALSIAGLLVAAPATAAEIKVLSAGAFKPVVTALVPAFEKQTGHKVTVDNDTAGGLAKRITGGEAFDVVIMPPGGIAPLVKAGKVVDGSAERLARVAIGVAVKKGAPAPDISTVDALKQALLKARAVAYIDPASGGSSGIYLAKLFEKLGIADKIRPNAVLVPGGLVAERLVSDEADIALHQISEILAVPGATLVGPIPREIQNYTVYAGALSGAARDVAAARALLDALKGPSAAAILKEKGMEAAPGG